MGERDTGGSAPSASLGATENTAQHSYYSRPISEKSASEASPLTGVHHHAPTTGPIVYGSASSAPFLAVTPGSENHQDGYGPGSKPYGPQPPYNPSYMTDKPITPRPNVYGKKTIVLNRTDAQKNSRKIKHLIALVLGLAIGSIIPITTYVYIRSIPMDSKNKTAKSFSREVFTTPRHTTVGPYLTDKHKNKYDDTYWSNKVSDTLNNPFLDDTYKDIFTERSWKLKTRDEILREINKPDLPVINGYEEVMKALQDANVKYDDSVFKYGSKASEMKDKTTEKKSRI